MNKNLKDNRLYSLNVDLIILRNAATSKNLTWLLFLNKNLIIGYLLGRFLHVAYSKPIITLNDVDKLFVIIMAVDAWLDM